MLTSNIHLLAYMHSLVPQMFCIDSAHTSHPLILPNNTSTPTTTTKLYLSADVTHLEDQNDEQNLEL